MIKSKTDYWVRVQRRKTIKYGEKQHHQDYITVPAQLSEALGLQPGQVMKCALNGNSLTYTITTEKLDNGKLNYEQWLDVIQKVIPSGSEVRKTYEQIRREGNIPVKTAPAIWVRQAEHDIELRRTTDPRTHRVLWTRASRTPITRRFKDATLTELSNKFS